MTTKTLLIEPITHNPDYMTTFHLDDGKAFSSNLRLANLGSVSSGTGAQYIANLGVMSLIRDIALYQDNEFLCRMRDAKSFLALQTQTMSNRWNKSYAPKDAKRWGFTYSAGVVGAGTNPAIPSTQQVSAPNRALFYATNDATTTHRGHLNLDEVLPILKQIKGNMISTKRWNKLNLRVFWETDPANIYIGAQTRTSLLQPYLIADQIMDEDLENEAYKMDSIVYKEVEQEDIVVGASTNFSKYLYSMRGKKIQKMAFQFQVANNAQLRKYVSKPQIGENLQITFNGNEVFQYNSRFQGQIKMNYAIDTLGNLNCPIGSNYKVHADYPQNALYDADLGLDYAQSCSHLAVNLDGLPCSECRIAYTRTAGGDALTIAVQYEVWKVVSKELGEGAKVKYL